MTRITLTLNGQQVTAEVPPRTQLADFLREHQGLTGTHVGCEHGICGACTVLVNGEIARSCINLAVACDGAEIRTIEHFDNDPLMTRLRTAFTQEHALQCGYCTPGMLIAARDLVHRQQRLNADEIRIEMSGNLCRCTGYMGIVRAIERVMAEGAADGATETVDGHGPVTGRRRDPAAAPELATAPSARASAASAPDPAAAPARRPEIVVGEVSEDGDLTRIAQSFVVHAPRDAVWDLLADIETVAACVPGAALDGPAQDGRVSGCMTVKVGPIGASFAGDGTISQDAAAYSGVLAGAGRDRSSASRARGEIAYRLSEQGNATQFDVEIAYALAGPLAQFGRAGLVRDIAAQLAAQFAANLEARLTGAAPPAAASQSLNPLALLARALWARLRALFGGGR